MNWPEAITICIFMVCAAAVLITIVEKDKKDNE